MELTLLLAAGGVLAGTFGALLGLGGGILVVPLLTLGFGLPFREAVAISLMAVITTSSVSAAVYLDRRVANLRLGLTLELFTATGALIGGLAAFLLPDRALAGLFAVMLGYTAWSMIRRAIRQARVDGTPARPVAASPGGSDQRTGPTAAPPVSSVTAVSPDPPGARAPAAAPVATGGYVAGLGGPDYQVRRLPAGVALAFLAGIVSALLGVGGGVIKVPAMNLVMGVPLRVATATSNLMIGVTASASAILYLLRGQVDAYVAGPVVIGVFAGAMLTSRVAHLVPVAAVRALFVIVLCYTAVEMGLRALAISIGVPGV